MCGSYYNPRIDALLAVVSVATIVAIGIAPSPAEGAFLPAAYRHRRRAAFSTGSGSSSFTTGVCPGPSLDCPTALAYLAGADSKDEIGGGKGGEDNNNNNGNKGGGNGGKDDDDAPTFQVFEDEECYDLCEIPDDVFDSGADEGDEILAESVEVPSPVETTSDSHSDVSSSVVVEEETEDLTLPANDDDSAGEGKYLSNLELSWSIQSSMTECEIPDSTHSPDLPTCGEPCLECEATGRTECRFCGGTGFFTVGTKVLGGGQVCPVCKDGEEECKKCRGSGWVANWRAGGGFTAEEDDEEQRKNLTETR